MKKHKLSHTPSAPLPQITAREEKEMMHDIFLMNLTDYSAAEIVLAVREGIVTIEEVEDCLSPSQS